MYASTQIFYTFYNSNGQNEKAIKGFSQINFHVPVEQNFSL